MKITQAVKKAAGFVAKELRGKVFWVWKKRTWFLPSTRILKERRGRQAAATLAVLTIAVVLVLARTVWAKSEIAEDYIWPLLALIAEWIASLLGQLLLWAIDLLIQVSKYNSFLDANVVSIGWVLVRDVANMFFILIMLVIAFGTMLKIEAYSWKKLLPRLILTALLVNFSKTFIGLLIDFSQVIMLTFVNGYAAAAGGNFMQMFQINKLFSINVGAQFTTDILGVDDKMTFSAALGFALGAVMLGIALIVVLIFAAILIFRVITLWILIVLSPLAFLLGTFPKGQEYYGQWWKQLQGQIIVGPMVAFFLWLSLAALGSGDNNAQISYTANQTGDFSQVSEQAKISTLTEVGEWDNLASFAVSIAMLLLSLQMISQLGVTGASLASGALSAIKSKATAAAKKLAVPAALGLGVPIAPVLGLGAGYGAGAGAWWAGKKAVVGGSQFAAKGAWERFKRVELEKIESGKKGIIISPWRMVKRFQAWSARGTKKLEKAETYAAAHVEDIYEKGRGRIPIHLERAKAASDAEFAKEYMHIAHDKEKLLDAMVTMLNGDKYDQTDKEDSGRLRGLWTLLAKNGWNDDLQGVQPLINRYLGQEEVQRIYEGAGDKATANHQTMGLVFQRMVTDKGWKNETDEQVRARHREFMGLVSSAERSDDNIRRDLTATNMEAGRAEHGVDITAQEKDAFLQNGDAQVLNKYRQVTNNIGNNTAIMQAAGINNENLRELVPGLTNIGTTPDDISARNDAVNRLQALSARFNKALSDSLNQATVAQFEAQVEARTEAIENLKKHELFKRQNEWRLLAQFKETGLEIGHTEIVGHSEYNKNVGAYLPTSPDRAEAIKNNEIVKIGAGKRIVWHPQSIGAFNELTGKLDKLMKKDFRITYGDVKDERTLNQMTSRLALMLMGNRANDTNFNKVIRAFQERDENGQMIDVEKPVVALQGDGTEKDEKRLHQLLYDLFQENKEFGMAAFSRATGTKVNYVNGAGFQLVMDGKLINSPDKLIRHLEGWLNTHQ